MAKRTTHNGKILFTAGARLSVLLAFGCSAAAPTPDEPSGAAHGDLLAGELEREFADELTTLDQDDIVFTYRGGAHSMDVRVDMTRFLHPPRDMVVELQLVTTLPDGTTQTHELEWADDEDQDGLLVQIPMIGDGRYEVEIVRIAIDGLEVSEESLARQSMTLMWRNPSEDGKSLESRAMMPDASKLDDLQARIDPSAACPGNGVWILNGDNNANSINGSGDRDQINGYAGDDWLYGHGCVDYLYGGLGNDHLFGNNGKDVLSGDGGSDFLDGGADADSCFAAAGSTFISCATVFIQ